MKVGPRYLGSGRCAFTVWAPLVREVALVIVEPEERVVPMTRDEWGYWTTTTENTFPGTRYVYRLEGTRDRPDPASNLQPAGVHEPSQIVDHGAFEWTDDDWANVPLETMAIYELHVGTFTPQGTFDAVIARLDALQDLGLTAIELMPVAQFPGDRNWGYDGVYPFAVQNSYGGPDGLKALVDACHRRGLAVVLDVVYNHLGPEGNYLREFGPYFTHKYRTPWGDAVNFDDAYSDGVRNFFVENALYWFREYHVDALRLDAVHAIYDASAKPFLEELAETVDAFSGQERPFYLIAESDLNDSKIIRPRERGGYGIDAQWCDDFHHALHTLLTGERSEYYVDFGDVEQLANAYNEGFVYSWDYSRFRKRRHGSSSRERPATQFVVYSQNHDQIGNRVLGERLSHLVSFEALKLAAGAVLLSPYIPLLFMGEEYGEEAPFLYFVSHSDPDLIEAVRKGRAQEFEEFHAQGDPPDPQSPETFRRSTIDWDRRQDGKHAALLAFYRRLFELRRSVPALAHLDKDTLEATADTENQTLTVRRWCDSSAVLCLMNVGTTDARLEVRPPTEANWKLVLDSTSSRWMGPGSTLPQRISQTRDVSLQPHSVALYEREMS